MDGTNGRRNPFSVLATTSPKILVGAGGRQCVVIHNGTSGNIYLGTSGTVASLGMILGSGNIFHDLFSSDEWWVTTASGSGTVDGYSVI